MLRKNLKLSTGLLKSITVVASLALFSPTVWAKSNVENFPNKPITIVLAYPAGGSTDVTFRVLAKNVSEILGQSVVVENKPGASGGLPVLNIKNVKKDGYTLVQAPVTAYKLPYIAKTNIDALEDLEYVINVAAYSFGLVVPADSPLNSLEDYIAYAKEHPGELTYGTPGVMSSPHLTMEDIASEAGVELSHIPYKGVAETLQGVLGGFVMSVADSPGWASAVENGELKLLVTWGDKRSERFPEVPTLLESGIDIVQNSPFGLVVPKGTDQAIVKKLHDAFKEAMERDNYRESLESFDMKPYYMSGEEYYQFAKEETKLQSELLESLGFKKK